VTDVADFSCYLGRAKESIGILKKAMRLNPNYPDWYSWSLAFALFTARRYDEALMNCPPGRLAIISSAGEMLSQLPYLFLPAIR
jgi:hypothetical protein